MLALGYAVRTPIWQNPDEPAHVNYVRWLAETRTLPELRPGDWDSALLSRLQNGTLLPTDSIDAIRYESWQPPLYYLLATPVWVLGPASDDARVVRLRLLGIVLGGLTLVVAYRAARYLLPEVLALAFPLVMVGVPMFTAVSASVSADPLANLLAAALLIALLRNADWRWLGVLLGLAIVTKLALVIFVPLALWRSWRAVPLAGLAVLPWLAHQVTTYGWTDPLALARHAEVVADQPRFPGPSFEYTGDFLRVSFHSLWAQFGWMAIPAPDGMYWMWGALMLVALLGLMLRPAWLRAPAWRLVLLTLLLAALAYLAYNLTFQQFQARYLFTALVPLCALLVRGWASVVPARWRVVPPFAIAVLLLAMNAYALTRVLTPGFAPIS